MLREKFRSMEVFFAAMMMLLFIGGGFILVFFTDNPDAVIISMAIFLSVIGLLFFYGVVFRKKNFWLFRRPDIR
jgi:hypothetical protein